MKQISMLKSLVLTLVCILCQFNGLLATDLNITPIGTMLERWTGSLAVAGQGDYVYVVNKGNAGTQGYIYDISNPLTPTLLPDRWQIGEAPSRFVLTNDGMWGLFTDKISYFSLLDPLHPEPKGSYPINLETTDVVFGDQISIQVVGGQGLKIISWEDPQNPVDVGSYNITECTRLALNGNTLAVNSSDTTVLLLDITDRANPLMISEWTAPSYTPYTLTLRDLGLGDTTLMVFYDYARADDFWWPGQLMFSADIANPIEPVIADTVYFNMPETVNWSYQKITVQDNNLSLIEFYSADFGITGTNLYTLRLDDPYNIMKQSLSHLKGGGSASYAVGKDRLYFGYNSYPMEDAVTWCVYDTQVGIKEIARHNSGGDIENVIVKGDRACVIGSHYMWDMDVSEPVNPVVVDSIALSFNWPVYDHQVFFHHATVYYLYDGCFYSHQPGKGFMDSLSGVSENTLILFAGDYSYLFHNDSVTVVDVSDPGNLLRHLPLAHNKGEMLSGLVVDDKAYLYSKGEGLSVMDLSVPLAPEQIALLPDTLTNPHKMIMCGHTLLLASYSNIRSYDVTDPGNPSILTYYNWGGYRNPQSVIGENILFSDKHGNWVLTDFSDPMHPVDIGNFDPEFGSAGIGIKDSVIYSAGGRRLSIFNGTSILSVPNDPTATPSTFALSQNYPNPFNSSTVISYTLSKSSGVTITVHDLDGRELKRPLENTNQSVGAHSLAIDAGDLPAGCYFYRVEAGGRVEVKKMVVLR